MRRALVLFVVLLGCGDGGGSSDCVVDELFCNGVERIVGGACVKVPADPCDDGVECTIDTCDEATDTCGHELSGDCAMCMEEQCTPDCAGRACGDDGCGGSCGACGDGMGCASVTGECLALGGEGTCANPRPLPVVVGIDLPQIHAGDTTSSLHVTIPTCNSTSTAVEDVWSFTVTEPTGIDARTSGYDTVLSLRSACEDDTPAATIACSDDAAPPGDFGSRVAALLAPGTYYLVVDGFDSTQYGAYELYVEMVAGCAPQCDGKFCGGDDGCGGTCGACGPGEACGADLRCHPDPCIPDCENDDGSPRVCGDDGCMGSCGDCTAPELCVPRDGTCAIFAECDHDAPQCSPACGADRFCGSDCVCHDVDAPLPDLVVNANRLLGEILFDTITVDANSCAVAEGCVGGMGERRVLRFSVEAINQGQATLVVDPPDTRPDLFSFSPCHGHYHFNGFATYALLDGSGNEVVMGRKQAYCMEDTEQVHLGPGVSCNKVYTCDEQGIQAGWSDLYGNTLDCQWLDITDVPPGSYQLTVTLNPNRAFEEVTVDNNTATVPVVISAP